MKKEKATGENRLPFLLLFLSCGLQFQFPPPEPDQADKPRYQEKERAGLRDLGQLPPQVRDAARTREKPYTGIEGSKIERKIELKIVFSGNDTEPIQERLILQVQPAGIDRTANIKIADKYQRIDCSIHQQTRVGQPPVEIPENLEGGGAARKAVTESQAA